jgi:hypothetical protein
MLVGVDGPPFIWEAPPLMSGSHIPLPCGALLSPLPLGTCHETYTLLYNILFYFLLIGEK